MKQPRVAYVVSHTHWDREWYLTFHQFRAALNRVVRRVLDALESDETFRHFVLDGQSIILEDHAAIHPEDVPRIRALAAAGRLSLGPWYVLPDEFLVSGEALARNLLVGHEVAEAFGGVQKVGYMPDSFGHVAQMPQILRRAGIDCFVYTRGNGDELEELGHEYVWAAPDGSEVLAINQCGGYCNAGGLGFDEIWHAHTRREVSVQRAVEQVRELFEKMGRLSRGDVWLLNNGCDHFPPQQDLGRILEGLRAAFSGTEFRHASLREYLEAVRASGCAERRYGGELIRGRYHHILSGVWSARMPLKQANERCQVLLADVVEPLCAATHFLEGRDHPSGALAYAWKLLLQNQPHDSICGCSTDEVHREMQPRFDGVTETAEQVLRYELEHLAPTFARRSADDGKTVLCVANPLPEPRTEVVERLVVLQPFGVRVEDLGLFDERGREVPFEILDVKYVERFWAVDYRTELDAERQHAKLAVYLDRFGKRMLRDAAERDTADCYLTIRFLAELPAVGHARFFLDERRRTSTKPSVPGSVRAGADWLENELVRVRLHPNGTFDLEDRRSGMRYPGLNLLEDTEDVGDEYDYCAAPETLTVTTLQAGGTVRTLDAGTLRGRLEAGLVMPLPERVDGDRRRRVDRAVDCPIRVRVGLTHDSPLVDVEVDFDNRARDHRLRVRFPTPVATDEIVSDGHFEVRRRPIRPPHGETWVQTPAGTWPQQEFSLVEDDRGGVAVLDRGLPEVAAESSGKGTTTLCLTLLRAVGWLSRDDFPTRRCSNAGPTLHTPDAQCIGRHRFRYAVVPYAGDWIAARIKSLSRRYRTPPPSIQGVEDQGVRGGRSLLGKRDPRTCISAIKKHATRDSLIVRLYNLTAEPVDEVLTCGLRVARAFRTDLLEERGSPLEITGPHELRVALGPHEILTLEIAPGSPGS